MEYGQGWFALCLVVTIIITGCDKSPPPPKFIETPPADVEVSDQSRPRPTTQELNSGPYKKLSLAPLPLSAKVPQSWECKMLPETALTFLIGPLPGDEEARISLQTGASVIPDKVDGMLDSIKKSAATQSTAGHFIDIRTAGDMRVLEERDVSPSLVDSRVNRVTWKLTYFIHRDIDYSTYVIDILGLDEKQLDQSRGILQKIIDSIVYEPATKTP